MLTDQHWLAMPWPMVTSQVEKQVLRDLVPSAQPHTIATQNAMTSGM